MKSDAGNVCFFKRKLAVKELMKTIAPLAVTRVVAGIGDAGYRKDRKEVLRGSPFWPETVTRHDRLSEKGV